MAQRISLDDVGRDAAVLSAVEMGLGSVLHSFLIPFSGHFLSLNQGFLLSRGVWRSRHKRGVRLLSARVSGISSVLKSLSPAGKRLTPMLAISAQGLLHAFGVALLGPNMAGIVLGMALLSVWAFVQPLLLYYLLYGNTLINVVEFVSGQIREVIPITQNQVVIAILAFVGSKALVAMILGVVARFAAEPALASYEGALLAAGSQRRKRTLEPRPRMSWEENVRASFRDVVSPLFLFSLLVTAVFFVASQSGVATAVWGILRPIAFGFLFFFLFRAVPDAWFPASVRHALDRLKAYS